MAIAHTAARRVRLRGTTVHVATYDTSVVRMRVAVFEGQAPLEAWCQARGIEEAIVGGFFARPDGRPLGELRIAGEAVAHVPFDSPWHRVRACVHAFDGLVRIAGRDALDAAPDGDLLQAGPALVRDGAVVVDGGQDDEGFSAGRRQFDSDITVGRHPRAALGVAPDRLVAVACDGRAEDEAGLTLEELAAFMAELGCVDALNLDGGGSTSLVSGGRLVNRPRRAFDEPEPGGRPISTALLFLPRD